MKFEARDAASEGWFTSHSQVDVSVSRVSVQVREKFKGSPQKARHYDYSFALEDLEDLAAEAEEWDEEGLPPCRIGLEWSSRVLAALHDTFPAPEVSSRPSGTILLLWHDGGGFLSLEIGDESFGMVVARKGFSSLYVNDRNTNLFHQLPRPVLEKGSTAALDRRSLNGLIGYARSVAETAVSTFTLGRGSNPASA